jgi:hypothetical protein
MGDFTKFLSLKRYQQLTSDIGGIVVEQAIFSPTKSIALSQTIPSFLQSVLSLVVSRTMDCRMPVVCLSALIEGVW